jgi:translocation and assembly module TamA
MWLLPFLRAAARMVSPAGRINTVCSIDLKVLPALAAALIFAIQPIAAQTRGADPELEALIPDSAVANPDAWAKGQISAPSAEAELDPTSPLADLPGFAVSWPDEGLSLPALVSLEPDADLAQALQEQAAAPLELRSEGDATALSPQLSLAFPVDGAAFPERKDFTARFRALSTILQLAKVDSDSIAQLAVRAKSDRALLERLLRIYGYYDAEVIQTVGGVEPGQYAASSAARVRFDIVPGVRFRFGAVNLAQLDKVGTDYPRLRESFAIKTGDSLSSDAIVTSRDDLDTALGENGYAFAKLGEPDLLVDHRREEGDLTLPVTPGGKYRFDTIVSDLPRFLPDDHLADIARFRPGDIYQRSQVEDLRRAIFATGLVSSATITPRETKPPQGDEPGAVALDVALTKAPLRTIAGAIGYDSGDGFRVEASWEHRNLFPPEGSLRLRGVAGTKEQLAGVTLRRNNFHGRDQVLTFDLYADTATRDAYEARTVALTGTFEKHATLIFQKPWTWAIGFEALASAEREGKVGGVSTPRMTYIVGALPLHGAYDGSDNLLDPSKGFRASLRISPEVSRVSGKTSTYARIQADASIYQPLGEKIVLAARARIGSIPGTDIANIAPSRRFYAGGGGSVRGFGYQQIGPRNSLGEPSGGRALSEFSLEARVKTGLFGGALSVVPFIDAGAVDRGAMPRLTDIRYGAGLGLRYQSGFGPIRIDVGTPLKRRTGESRIAVTVSLGQAF